MKPTVVIVTIVVLSLAIASFFTDAMAYPLSEPQSSDITSGINNLVNGVLKGFAPGGSKDIINSAKGLNVPAVTSSSSFSAGDLITPIKAVLTLIINLFFVVIQVVVDILEVLLGAISNYNPS